MYVTEQPAFLNAAVLGRTDLPPLQLLYHCKQIEKQAGVGGCDSLCVRAPVCWARVHVLSCSDLLARSSEGTA